jgi:hypothetical protein
MNSRQLLTPACLKRLIKMTTLNADLSTPIIPKPVFVNSPRTFTSNARLRTRKQAPICGRT